MLRRPVLLVVVLVALAMGSFTALTPGTAHAGVCDFANDFHTGELLIVCDFGDDGFEVYGMADIVFLLWHF